MWSLKKEGYSDYTIDNYGRALRTLAKHCNLNNPETVKSFLATLEATHGYKKQLVYGYAKYAKIHGLKWEKPKYIPRRKMPRIPTEEKINLIIANASPKLRTAISMSKDTGLRPVELMRLKLKDVGLDKKAVYPETAKHGNPRVLKITNKTLHMLIEYIGRANIQPNQRIFANWRPIDYSKYFRTARNKTAKKMGDPSINQIRLYDLRHFFATMLYHHTNNLVFVKQQLGHKSIETTMIYTQLLQLQNEDEYTCKVAQNAEQAQELIENGFEYITTTPNELMLFRKRK